MNYNTFKTGLKSAGLTLAGMVIGYLPFANAARAEDPTTLQRDVNKIAQSLMRTRKPEFYLGFENGYISFHSTRDYQPPQPKDPKGSWFQYEKEFRIKDRFGNTDTYNVALFDLSPFHSLGKEDLLRVHVEGRAIDYSKWDGLGRRVIFAVDRGLNGIGPEDNCGIDNIRPHEAIQYIKNGEFDYGSWYRDQIETLKQKFQRSKK